jgi:heme-degrading monooxygenase HmoA
VTYIRMSCWTAEPDSDAESLARWAGGTLARWREQPGLLHVHMLEREGTQDRMTLSVWDSVDSYDRFIASGQLVEIIASFDGIYAAGGAPVATEWVVMTDDWPMAL